MKKKFHKMILGSLPLVALSLAAIILIVWLLSNSFVTVNVAPTNATVFFDNELLKTNRAGKKVMIVSPGQHTIRAEADGYIGSAQTNSMRRGFITGVEVKLKEIGRSMQMSSEAKELNLGKMENSVSYLSDNGSTIYQSVLDLDSQNSLSINTYPLTSSKLSGIANIIWSPTKELALFRKSDGVYLFDFKKYDFVNQTETFFGTDIGDIAWSPDNSKIAYYYHPSNGEKTLVFSNLSNTQKERVLNLAELNIDDPIIKWSSNSEWITLIPRNKDQDSNKLYVFNAYSRSLVQLGEIAGILNASFAPDSLSILFNAKEGSDDFKTYKISLISENDDEATPLSIKLDLNNIFWVDDSDLLAWNFDKENSSSQIVGFSYKKNERNKVTLKGFEPEKIISLASIENNSILVYQTSKGVFALNMEQ